MSRHVVVSDNVVMLESPIALTREETERLAKRVADFRTDGDLTLTDTVIDALLEEERDYRAGLEAIERVVSELLLRQENVLNQVAVINNKLQPVLFYARGAKPLEVRAYAKSYEDALQQILRLVRALHSPGDEEWVATGVRLIQSLLETVVQLATV